MAEARSTDLIGPLGGIRVLDLSGPIGAYGTRLLADLGADVILVESPEGDQLRRRPPFHHGFDGPDASLAFAVYHANKRGVTLRTCSPSSLELLEALGRHVDVVVISPSRRCPLAGFDADEQSLSWVPDDMIVCSVTPFGLTGPYRHIRATHLTSYAMSGAMHHVGPADGPPLVVPGQAHWDLAAMHGALCVLAALEARSAVGGQLIDISAQEVEASHDFFFERWAAAGERRRPRTTSIGYPPTGAWECQDGRIDIAAHQARHWDAFLELLGNPDILQEPALREPAVRQQIFDGLRLIIEPLIAGRSREDLFSTGQSLGLPIGVFNTPLEFLSDPQLADRDFFVSLPTPTGEQVTAPGSALSSEPSLTQLCRSAPTLGEHNQSVYCDELGFTVDDLATWREQDVV